MKARWLLIAAFAVTVRVESARHAQREEAFAAARDASELRVMEMTGRLDAGYAVAAEIFGAHAFAQAPPAGNFSGGGGARSVSTGKLPFTFTDGTNNNLVIADDGTDAEIRIPSGSTLEITDGTNVLVGIEDGGTAGILTSLREVFGKTQLELASTPNYESYLSLLPSGAWLDAEVGTLTLEAETALTLRGKNGTVQLSSGSATDDVTLDFGDVSGTTASIRSNATNARLIFRVNSTDVAHFTTGNNIIGLATDEIGALSATSGITFRDDAGNPSFQMEDGAVSVLDARNATFIFEALDTEFMRGTATAVTVPNGIAVNIGNGALDANGTANFDGAVTATSTVTAQNGVDVSDGAFPTCATGIVGTLASVHNANGYALCMCTQDGVGGHVWSKVNATFATVTCP
jgi:hypothetical protein